MLLKDNRKPLVYSSLIVLYFALVFVLHILMQNNSIHESALVGKLNKAAKSAFLTCPTCPKNSPRKHAGATCCHANLPNGPFMVWQMGFIHLPPSHGYKYVLVMVYMLSHWTEAFPCK